MKEISIFSFIFLLVIVFLFYALASQEILNAKIIKEAKKKGFLNIEIKKTEKTFEIDSDTKNPIINFLKHGVLINHGLSVYQKIPKKIVVPPSEKSKKKEIVVIAETYFSYPVKVHFEKTKSVS